MSRDGAEVTSTGRSFHARAPATKKAPHPIIGSLTCMIHVSDLSISVSITKVIVTSDLSVATSRTCWQRHQRWKQVADLELCW